jgi:DNA-binding transcriptional MocR family regulator
VTHTSWRPDLTQFPGPKYLSLSRALREAIAAGELAPGAQLPTVRDLAWDLRVTPGTVSRAYQIATQEGLLAATVGRGTFVAASRPQFGPTQPIFTDRDAAAGKFDLRAPRLPEVGQGEAFAAALAALVRNARTDWLDYPSQKAEAPLRAAVVDWVSDRILGPITADDIALTHGGQNGLALIFQCVLRGDRPVVLLEELAYAGFRHAARLSRADLVPVETDARGIVPAALAAACRRHGAQVLCLTPDAQNPTTAHMDPERRAEIVALARSYDLQIIEDDCYNTALADAPTIRALAPERTWFVGGLSKTLSAALRFGYIVCPSGRGETGRLTAQHGFFALARPVSDLVLHLMADGSAARLRARVQAAFAERLQAAVNALGAHDLGWQPGLPFLWLPLPSGWRASTFTRMAEAEGVMVRSADEYALVSGRAPNGVRLALNGRMTRAETEEACNRLSRLLSRPSGEVAV